MNRDPGVFGQFTDCNGKSRSQKEMEIFYTPCAISYTLDEDQNTHYLVIRDPTKGRWNIGLLYQEHNLIKVDKQDATGFEKSD